MGRASKRKGNRIERELVHLHQAAGLPCRRVPLSGAATAFSGELAGDVVVDLPDGGELRAECKARASGDGFKTLERWLADKDLLFLRRDRAAPLVLLPWSTYLRLLGRQGACNGNGG